MLTVLLLKECLIVLKNLLLQCKYRHTEELKIPPLSDKYNGMFSI